MTNDKTALALFIQRRFFRVRRLNRLNNLVDLDALLEEQIRIKFYRFIKHGDQQKN